MWTNNVPSMTSGHANRRRTNWLRMLITLVKITGPHKRHAQSVPVNSGNQNSSQLYYQSGIV
jgi:hypothetical protein